jgi:hypothetical protein
MGFSFGIIPVGTSFAATRITTSHLDLAQWQTAKALEGPYSYTVQFGCLRHVGVRRNVYTFFIFETDSKPCGRGQIRIVIS